MNTMNNPIEQAVADIWIEILDIETAEIEMITPDSNFFELGGHSLLANLIGTRIREDLGVDLDLERFFAEPTIRNVAQVIAEAQSELLEGSKLAGE